MFLRIYFISLTLIFFSCNSSDETAKKEPIQIQFVLPTTSTLPLFNEYVGQTLGKSDVQVTTRVEGIVTKVHFKEGSQITKGQLLYTIDPTAYQTKVDEADGELEKAKAELVNAQENLKRIRPLADMNAVSKRDLDEAIAKEKSAKAQVRAHEAIKNSQVIELNYCNITASISGVIGISNAKEGDYVAPHGTKSNLNTISDVTQIRVRFSITENEYLEFNEKRSATSKQRDSVKLSLILSNGNLYPYTGTLNFKDRSIDPTTGSMTIEALFENPNHLLIPGQYVRVRFQSEEIKNAITIPQQAVREIQGIFQVYIIDEQNKLQVRVVKIGQKTNGLWVITDGLTGNERIALLGNNFLTINTVVAPIQAKTDSTSTK
jgi:membrane fusion protein, multidrug efflux system